MSRCKPFVSFHPLMALFPMSGVLRGFAPAAYEKAVCGVLYVHLNENPCAALLIRKTPYL
jgi:hypothetical protein